MAAPTSFYRVSTRRDPRTNSYPVERVMVARDGNLTIRRMGKRVANSLEEFRKEFPNTPVQGEVGDGHLRERISELTEEQLSGLGIARTTSVAGTVEPVFASEQAAELAKYLNPEIFVPGKGSGSGGKWNVADVRSVIDSLK